MKLKKTYHIMQVPYGSILYVSYATHTPGRTVFVYTVECGSAYQYQYTRIPGKHFNRAADVQARRQGPHVSTMALSLSSNSPCHVRRGGGCRR